MSGIQLCSCGALNLEGRMYFGLYQPNVIARSLKLPEGYVCVPCKKARARRRQARRATLRMVGQPERKTTRFRALIKARRLSLPTFCPGCSCLKQPTGLHSQLALEEGCKLQQAMLDTGVKFELCQPCAIEVSLPYCEICNRYQMLGDVWAALDTKPLDHVVMACPVCCSQQ